MELELMSHLVGQRNAPTQFSTLCCEGGAYQRKSLFKWMKQSLAVNKLLVESSNNIEEFAYYYAMKGKLVELAVLLIFAREKVLNGRMMIPQCIRNQILSLIDEEVKLMRECIHRELTQIHQKMMGMSSTVLLLEVFERAGHTIGEYLQSQQPDVADVVLLSSFIISDPDPSRHRHPRPLPCLQEQLPTLRCVHKKLATRPLPSHGAPTPPWHESECSWRQDPPRQPGSVRELMPRRTHVLCYLF